MKQSKDITDIAKRILAWYERSDISASDEQVYEAQAAKHCRSISLALLTKDEQLKIATEALETIKSESDESYSDLSYGETAAEALASIRSLPSHAH